ncbi:MAG: glycosyltransferase family 2 protein [Actinobacteria bacterium]|nr:MAG: glycosyltransferase family 2 protein [Actinomycetota bacterium]
MSAGPTCPPRNDDAAGNRRSHTANVNTASRRGSRAWRRFSSSCSPAAPRPANAIQRLYRSIWTFRLILRAVSGERSDATVSAPHTHPLVSVVIAAYNTAGYVGETLESVLGGQDWSPYEVIVVDDGSSDDTADVVKSFDDVRYIWQENGGPGSARNTGVAAAQGDFIAVSDSDDLVAPGRLGLQARYLIDHPEVDAVLGRQEWLNAPDWLARDAVYGDLAGVPVGGSAMFRRDALVAVDGYDPSFRTGEDTDLLIRMRERGHAYVVLPQVVLYRRFREDSLTGGQAFHVQLLRSLRGKVDREHMRQGETSS